MSITRTKPRDSGDLMPPAAGVMTRRRPSRKRYLGTAAFHLSSGALALIWAFPIIIVLVTSFRTYDDVSAHGVAGLPTSFTLAPYVGAWAKAGLFQALVNSLIVTIPTVFASLFLSALAAFALSRYRIPLRRTLLLIMLAGNLLPPQMLLVPVFRITEQFGIYDTLFSLILIHTAFGLGFYIFVLYGFMRSIPFELQDAASLDGAGVLRTFWQVILPLTRPALAALGALSFTWIFNDLLWSITLIRSENKLPTTAAILSLQGEYYSDWGVISAATIIAALPCVIVFLIFQRSFIGGLALGSIK